MAGTYFEILRPGYSTLTTHDLPYKNGTGETGVAVFNPLSARPLIEGEWLEYAASPTGGWAATRGGANIVTVAGTPEVGSQGAVPAWPHWLERGRFDAQTRQYAHLLKGPVGFSFRTRLCDSTGLAEGSLVSVWDIDMGDGVVRRGLALASGPAWVVGTVERIFGTNDIAVYFNPFYLA
jgi:hypothetical protein